VTEGHPDWPSATAIAAAFGLRGPIGQLEPVAGAWSNRVFRLVVGDQVFAVKEMLDTWRLPTWFDRVDEAWGVELAAIEAGVEAPEPVPNPSDGSWRADVDREGGADQVTVRLHRWVEADTAPNGVADLPLAVWSGSTLARLHGLDLRTARPELFDSWTTDAADRWPGLVEAAERARAPWLDLARAATPAIGTIRVYLEARDAEPSDGPLSHRDVDQKNVLLAAAGPMLCDWDVAGPVDPAEELVDVALSMARWEVPDVARAVFDGYRRAGGDDIDIVPAHLAPMLFSSVHWLVLNVERALDLRELGPEEQERGAALVPGLLERLPERVAMAEHIDTWLRS
jgi:hypothetical protein